MIAPTNEMSNYTQLSFPSRPRSRNRGSRQPRSLTIAVLCSIMLFSKSADSASDGNSAKKKSAPAKKLPLNERAPMEIFETINKAIYLATGIRVPNTKKVPDVPGTQIRAMGTRDLKTRIQKAEEGAQGLKNHSAEDKDLKSDLLNKLKGLLDLENKFRVKDDGDTVILEYKLGDDEKESTVREQIIAPFFDRVRHLPDLAGHFPSLGNDLKSPTIEFDLVRRTLDFGSKPEDREVYILHCTKFHNEMEPKAKQQGYMGYCPYRPNRKKKFGKFDVQPNWNKDITTELEVSYKQRHSGTYGKFYDAKGKELLEQKARSGQPLNDYHTATGGTGGPLALLFKITADESMVKPDYLGKRRKAEIWELNDNRLDDKWKYLLHYTTTNRKTARGKYYAPFKFDAPPELIPGQYAHIWHAIPWKCLVAVKLLPEAGPEESKRLTEFVKSLEVKTGSCHNSVCPAPEKCGGNVRKCVLEYLSEHHSKSTTEHCRNCGNKWRARRIPILGE